MTAPTQRAALPIDAHLAQILASLRQHPALVLKAPTGAGKTTRLPVALLEEGFVGGQLLLVQPRRVAARAAARRISAELGVKLGQEVGYQVRYERVASARTRLLVVTDGIFQNLLLRDPFLEGIGAVLLDEFHERRLQVDLALALLKQVQAEVNPSLRLVVMSATLDPGPICAYLGGCPGVETQGRSYPVEVAYLGRPDDRPIPIRAAEGVRAATAKRRGDVLVFLPGMAEIRATAQNLEDDARREGWVLLPLHGSLTAQEQDAALEPNPKRKVILATNVAETSLTIDGVEVVVDAGFARVMAQDPATGLDKLRLERISRASAEQRAGRAGRTAPGYCLRLWTPGVQQGLAEMEVPEVRRVDLMGAVLALLSWGERKPWAFDWFERPTQEAVEQSMGVLRWLDAIDAEARVTKVGEWMVGAGVEPRLARLMWEAQRLGCAKDTTDALVAWLEGEDPKARGFGSARPFKSSQRAARTASGAPTPQERFEVDIPHDLLESWGFGVGVSLDVLGAVLLAAFPDRLAKRRAPSTPRGLMVGNRGVALSPDSSVKEASLFLCLAFNPASTKTAEATVTQACEIPVRVLPSAHLSRRVDLRFDLQKEQVNAVEQLCYLDLPIEERPAPLPSDEAVAKVLAVAAAQNLSHALKLADEGYLQLRARIARLKGSSYAPPDLPDASADEALVGPYLEALCVGHRAIGALKELDLGAWLWDNALTYAQRQALERHTPTHFVTPNKARARFLYSLDVAAPAVLAVRIQDAFGLREAPLVLGQGVVLHLLAPNMRPQQVTQDLQSFWSRTYPELRKELRARYPKQPWPEDPLQYKPVPKTPGPKP